MLVLFLFSFDNLYFTNFCCFYIPFSSYLSTTDHITSLLDDNVSTVAMFNTFAIRTT